ncbi:MAG: exo-alpha-sialidase [Planctomycetaceae bacterium]|nr:exo-alpha-sialidase [Planctomycetaceae bacterium]
MFHRTLVWVTALILPFLLAGECLAEKGAFESWPAIATAEHPRNSEADVIVLKDGSVLVGWTEFQKANTDFTSAHIAGRRSADGGRTWGKKFILRENIGKLNTMSLSFLRVQDSGEILMFFLVKNSTSDLDLMVCRSQDEAATWSDPLLITPEVGYHIMNNARAIQLSTGRILCPVSTTPLIHNSQHPLQSVCYYSDDDGKTWSRSRNAVSVPKRGAMEPGVIEREDGSLYQIIRTQMGKIWVTESTDGGESWSKAREGNLTSPEAPATLIPLPAKQGWLIFHNPHVDSTAKSHGGRRTPLVARISRDEGRTWSKPIMIAGDLKKTYSYISARVAGDRVLLTYYVEDNQRYSLKFKSLPFDDFDVAK